MAQGPKENTVERHLVKRVRAMRGRAVKLSRVRGWPDRIILLHGVPVHFVETKRPKGGRFEPLQLRVHQLIRDMGHTVVVLYTKDQVDIHLAGVYLTVPPVPSRRRA